MPLSTKHTRTDQPSHIHRKYLRVATDSEEVLAFLLGELVKDRSRYLTLKNAGKQPASVSIKISDFEARVSLLSYFSSPLFADLTSLSRPRSSRSSMCKPSSLRVCSRTTATRGRRERL